MNSLQDINSPSYSNKPSNTNLVQPTKYILSFPEINDAVYFCQSVNVPGVQMGEVIHFTPNLDLYAPGTKMTYAPFEMTFLVNEDLSSWIRIHNWIRGITTEMQAREITYNRTNAILTILSGLNNPKIRIKFDRIFPTSLSDLEFDTKQSAEDHIVATATFRYDFFDIEVL